MQELRDHRERQRRDDRRARQQAWEYVFTRDDGRPLHPEHMSRPFLVQVAEAGLQRIRLHDLRHTRARHALAAGVPLKVVQEQLGHSSITLTADTCTDVLPEVSRAAADLVARSTTELPSLPPRRKPPEATPAPPRGRRGARSGFTHV